MHSASHGNYMLLLRVSGMDEREIDERAQAIHDDFMEEFGPAGAFTILLLRLDHVIENGTNLQSATSWTHVVRYFGPPTSVRWLQERLETDFHGITTQTMTARDITGRY